MIRLLPVAISLLLLISCSSIKIKNLEIRRTDGSVLKLESLEANEVNELQLMQILSAGG